MTGAILTLFPSGEQKKFSHGKRLDEALLEMNHPVATPCGGRGLCGKCSITVAGDLSARTETENRLLHDTGTRLACQTTLSGNATAHEPSSDKKTHTPVILPGDVPPVDIAIDIGTTTLQVAVVQPSTGDIIRQTTLINPQRRYGHDVISRIAAASDFESRHDLTRLVHAGIRGTVVSLIEEANMSVSDISAFTSAGNTTMTYFLLGLSVESLGTHPYTAPFRDFEGFTSSLFGLGDIPLNLFPSASAFVGGDLVGGMALLDSEGFRKNTFFIDMGTNGEMFLRTSGDMIFAASCAMGPALEGMNITCGMTATEGALTHAREEGGRILTDVIGSGEASGISGTGLIDLVSLMLADGAVTGSGALGSSGRLFTVDTAKGVIPVTDRIYITRQDIRNLQLAKGASLATARILFKAAAVDPSEIENVVIAGAFGEHLDLENFKNLRFLPDFPNAVYSFRGNTSLLSSAHASADRDFIRRAALLRDRTRVMELSGRIDFQDFFMDSLNF